MRFECTIMRHIETGSTEESDNTSDMLEMRSRTKRKGKQVSHDSANHHTNEYWQPSGHNHHGGRTKSEWVKEEEWLNKGHKASESFSVLNELVVVSYP